MDLLNDIDYQDYRELICYERPACVLLHYVYGVTNLRTQLYDRFFFEWVNDKIKSHSNELSNFLGTYKVCEDIEEIISSENNVSVVLKSYANKKSALILPYFNQIGSSKVLSTWLVEFCDNDISKVFLTSLRGDDFFFRKVVNLENVIEKLHVVNGRLKFQSLGFNEEIIEYKNLNAEAITDKTEVAKKLNTLAKEFVEKRVSGVKMGSQALWDEYQFGIKDYRYWKELVDDGFQKALLVKLFWPLQFYYQPFAVFLKFCFNNGIIFREQSFIAESRLLIDELIQNAQVITSLAGLFAFRRDEATFKRFCDSLERSLFLYTKLEDIFLKNQLGCDASILLSNSLRFSKEATGQFLAVKFLPTFSPLVENSGLFSLVDNFNVSSDKLFIRQKLESTSYHVDFISSTNFDPSDFKKFEFPFVLKSAFGFASGGTFLVHSEEELRSGLHTIRNLNRFIFKGISNNQSGVLAERFIQGKEYAAECITVGGKTCVVSIFSKPDNSDTNFLDSVYLLDPNIQKELMPQIQKWVDGLLKEVKYTDGPSHIEFRIDGKSSIPFLVEINFRPGGSGALATLLSFETGVPVMGLMAKSIARSLPWSELEKQSFDTKKLLFCKVPSVERAGRITNIRGRAELSSHPNIFWSDFFKEPGQYITPPPFGTDYLGKILGKASSLDDLDQTLNFIDTNVGVEYE